MSGLDALTAMIYHERQQKDSMLCAQHALNSLLQGNYFTAPDLAAIAQSFDALEQGALDGQESSGASTNMDDTGFFSVQVMDKALEVWGLNLIRWRSEQMRPYLSSPHTQLAFILNLHQHWFTLRRFGPATTDPATDPGIGHWFNLNSSLPKPKWVSRTYLGMFLQQCETEGYSVFAVVQADPSKELALPRTEADSFAATVDAPGSSTDPSAASGSTSMPGALLDEHEEIEIPEDREYTLDEEDLELQAALQASITGNEYERHQETYVPRPPVPAPALRQAPAPPPMEESTMEDEDEDPVAASLARQRATLEEMRRMQEAAFRETYEDEVSNFGRRAQRRLTAQEREEEEIRRAIAASMAEAGSGSGEDRDNTNDDPDWRPEDDEDGPIRRGPPIQPAPAPEGVAEEHRVYDDEDAQLQAALRASLESAPEGYVHPPTPPPRHQILPTPAASVSAPSEPPAVSISTESESVQTEDGDKESERLTSPPPVDQQVDMDEIRRRRLARFGG